MERKWKNNNNENASKAEYASAENVLVIHRAAINEITLTSKIRNMINEENVIVAPGQGKAPVFALGDEFCE